MLALVIATCSILMGIHIQQKLAGLACAWHIGHAKNVHVTSNRLAPGAGAVELARELVPPLHITLGLAGEQLTLHSTIRPCWKNGLHIVMLIGSARSLFVSE